MAANTATVSGGNVRASTSQTRNRSWTTETGSWTCRYGAREARDRGSPHTAAAAHPTVMTPQIPKKKLGGTTGGAWKELSSKPTVAGLISCSTAVPSRHHLAG